MSSPFIELIDQQEIIRKEYDMKKKMLEDKKENLWKTNNLYKWEMNEREEQIDSSLLLKDKEYAFSKMCYNDNCELKKIYDKLGYYYYYNNEQFENIIKNFETMFEKNIKEFANSFGPTLNDSVQIYSELASCI